MHTAEHILNQTMIRMYNCGRSFSMHLEKKKSKCDYHFDHALTAEEETEIARRVNEVISMNLPVTESLMPIEEAGAIVSLGKLPDDAGNQVRIIKVGDYDTCACIGDHVTNTGHIGQFVMISSSFEEGVLRIRYKLNRVE